MALGTIADPLMAGALLRANAVLDQLAAKAPEEAGELKATLRMVEDYASLSTTAIRVNDEMAQKLRDLRALASQAGEEAKSELQDWSPHGHEYGVGLADATRKAAKLEQWWRGMMSHVDSIRRVLDDK